MKLTRWMIILLGLILNVTAHSANLEDLAQPIQQLIQKGEQQCQQGHLRQANTAFTQALSLAEQQSDLKAETLSRGLLGYTLFQQQHYATAEPLLKHAWQASIQNNWPKLAALHANHLGNYYAHQRAQETAQQYYHKSLQWALKSKDTASALQARLNLRLFTLN